MGNAARVAGAAEAANADGPPASRPPARRDSARPTHSAQSVRSRASTRLAVEDVAALRAARNERLRRGYRGASSFLDSAHPSSGPSVPASASENYALENAPEHRRDPESRSHHAGELDALPEADCEAWSEPERVASAMDEFFNATERPPAAVPVGRQRTPAAAAGDDAATPESRRDAAAP